MTDCPKLATLLDEPEVRELLFGLAHVGGKAGTTGVGPARVHAIVLDLAVTTTEEQYRSWLDDDEHNEAMTVEQVRVTIGEAVLEDLAGYTSSTADAVAWQLAEVLPDLVDAISPGGTVIGVELFAREIDAAILEDDDESGAFGDRVH